MEKKCPSCNKHLTFRLYIRRKLKSNEIVHHINNDKLDNRIKNLKIVSRTEHNKIHKHLTKEKRDDMWSDEELIFLKTGTKVKDFVEKFPKRTIASFYQKRHRLSLIKFIG